MLTLISPAKTLDFETTAVTNKATQPEFLIKSAELIRILKTKTPADIARLMSISDKLAHLNVARYTDWSIPFTANNAKQAVLAFKGDVYTGLDAETLTVKQFDFAQNHLRILSGLYGILRPLDLIQAYRLEMGIKIPNPLGKDLYAFWQETINKYINDNFKNQVIINLASGEYFKSVLAKSLQGKVISPAFKDLKNGKYKIISFYAKKARGLMSRFIIENNIDQPEGILAFDVDGYTLNENFSRPYAPVFTRDPHNILK